MMTARYNRPLLAFLLLASTFSCASQAIERQLACANKTRAFDGTTTLRYASVTVTKSSLAEITARHPALCVSRRNPECDRRVAMTPGAIVGVAATCGQYAYVQYIGDQDVTVGWIHRANLAYLHNSLPYDDGDPGPHPMGLRPYSKLPRMSLLKGRGVPVCEAYLQRLNQTIFHEPPFCGRPENDQVPGFARLDRSPITVDEANRLFAAVNNFPNTYSVRTNEPHYVAPDPPNKGSAAIYLVNNRFSFEVKNLAPGTNVSAWRYETSLDVENNGHPVALLLWRGVMPDWGENECGASTPPSPYGVFGRQSAFVMTNENPSGIDYAKTVRVFQLSNQYPESGDATESTPVTHSFGSTVGLFAYRGSYYFDTYGGSDNEPASLRALDMTRLFVYQHKAGQTQNICTFQSPDR